MTLRTKLLATALLASSLSLTTVASAQQVPPTEAGDRSMEFRPGLGTNHERVPGGKLLVIAYGAILLVLGGYVAFIARRAARVDDEVRRLEDELARRRPPTEGEV